MLRIYTINLDHRGDRWAQARANYAAHGLDPSAVERFPAVHDPSFGALGCARSHVGVLSRFLTRDREPWLLVLEDDFDFVRPFAEVGALHSSLQRAGLEWDACRLMGTAVLARPAGVAGVARVLEAQSAAAYLVGRAYAARLLACFAESLPVLEAHAAPALRGWAVARAAIDVAWKPMQRRDRWYIATPSIGRQRPGWSDIEQRDVDYDAHTHALATP